jgi:hypothetical protein
VFWSWWSLVYAIVGAFGTAFVHEHTGRDPRTGGLIGAAVGLVLGPVTLVMLWVWLYYNRLNVHVIAPRRRWWSWWRPGK